jgi:hypothetical protein
MLWDLMAYHIPNFRQTLPTPPRNAAETVASSKYPCVLARAKLMMAGNQTPWLHRKQFYQPVWRRRGGKAGITLQRKFLGVLYPILKNEWV